jgi:hypothetical protein
MIRIHRELQDEFSEEAKFERSIKTSINSGGTPRAMMMSIKSSIASNGKKN